jgi:hypothetical protein
VEKLIIRCYYGKENETSVQKIAYRSAIVQCLGLASHFRQRDRVQISSCRVNISVAVHSYLVCCLCLGYLCTRLIDQLGLLNSQDS